MSQQHKPTLIGLPSFDREDPFPLTPYADVHVYTPSRERVRGEQTPVYIPPARRVTPAKPQPIPERSLEVSAADKRLACVIVCWLLALGAAVLGWQ